MSILITFIKDRSSKQLIPGVIDVAVVEVEGVVSDLFLMLVLSAIVSLLDDVLSDVGNLDVAKE